MGPYGSLRKSSIKAATPHPGVIDVCSAGRRPYLWAHCSSTQAPADRTSLKWTTPAPESRDGAQITPGGRRLRRPTRCAGGRRIVAGVSVRVITAVELEHPPDQAEGAEADPDRHQPPADREPGEEDRCAGGGGKWPPGVG